MAELVDAADSKSAEVNPLVGSSPILGTNKLKGFRRAHASFGTLFSLMRFSMKYVFFLILCMALYASNPSSSEFNSFVSKNVKIKMLKEGESKEMSNFAGGISSLISKSIVVRKNFLFFSTFKFDTGLLRDFGVKIENVTFLGIAGQFVKIG